MSRRSAIAIVGVLALGGCALDLPSLLASGVPAPSSRDGNTGAVTTPAAGTSRAVADLPVKGRAPKTGYTRSEFGQAWSDDVSVELGHNGCDTRNDILRRDLTSVSIKPRSNGCAVLTGTLHDPYSGATINFRRGPATSSSVQIDHVVSLSNAWQTGAQSWSPEKRRNFANDPRNLLAVSGVTNQSKGDGDTATWLPPNKVYRCSYVTRQVTVKRVYGLWVTAAEQRAMQRILATCRTPIGTNSTGVTNR